MVENGTFHGVRDIPGPKNLVYERCRQVHGAGFIVFNLLAIVLYNFL